MNFVNRSQPSFDDLFSKSNKEYTYADQYPIFMDQEKLSKIIGSSSVPLNPISASLDFKYKLQESKPQLSSLPETKIAKTQDNAFRASKYPQSSLNVELEKQCILADLYQNIDKLKYKTKVFPPVKVVWSKSPSRKKKPLKAAILNLKAVMHGDMENIACSDCAETRCKCKVTDAFCDNTWDNIRHKYSNRSNIYDTTKRSKLKGATQTRASYGSNYDNWLAERIQQRRTRRRKVESSDYSGLHNNVLSVSPKRLYFKVLDDSEDI